MVKTSRFCGCLVAGECTCQAFECQYGCGAVLARDEVRWAEGKYGPVVRSRACRECKRKADRAHYDANRATIRSRQNAKRADETPEEREARLATRRERYDPEAMSAYQREYRTRPGVKERRRDEYLRKRYGITLADYDAMLEAQGGTCAICRNPEAWPGRGGNYHVDHCHETGAVRGLLCSACNTALGTFGDSEDRLIAAAAYLSEARAKMVSMKNKSADVSVAKGIRGQT